MIRNIFHKTFDHFTIHSRTYARGGRVSLRRPPSISNSSSTAHPNEILHNNNDEIDDIDAEDLSKYDIDHEQAHKSHKQFEREQFQQKEKTRHWTVGTKYFRQKQPNFLTWVEKQQIRFLHKKDPIEWSCDRLAESFPADSEIIAQICKSHWLPKDDKRIQRHDASVQENWKQFNANQFQNISTHLQEHLKKFSQRGALKAVLVPGGDDESIQIKSKIPEPKSKEFSSIILSAEKYKLKNSIDDNLSASKKMHKVIPNDETYLLSKVIDKKPVMFKPTSSATAANPERKDENLLDQQRNLLPNPNGTGIVCSSTMPDSPFKKVKKFDSTVQQSEDEQMKNLSMPAIRENITIPMKFYKKGATYKLGDCYYDDDGEFLYRVPGMTGD